MRIALYQMEDRGSVEANVRAACDAIERVDADFICFPEYFTIPADYKDRGKTVEDAWKEITIPTLDAMKRASRNFDGYIVCGSVVEKHGGEYYNTCFVFRKGKIVARYRKMNPVDKELAMGIRPGREAASFETEFGRIGILICADCLNGETVRRVATESDVIFLPISLTDPAHPRVRGHPVSERIAKTYGVIVAKVSRIARGLGVKSAVVSPAGIVAEAESCCREEILIVDFESSCKLNFGLQ